MNVWGKNQNKIFFLDNIIGILLIPLFHLFWNVRNEHIGFPQTTMREIKNICVVTLWRIASYSHRINLSHKFIFFFRRFFLYFPTGITTHILFSGFSDIPI